MHNHLRMVAPGALTTVQDQGRLGYARFGVPQSGPMDPFALRAANDLVGNPAGTAGLEFALDAPVLKMDADGLVAGAGCGWSMRIGGRAVGLWRAARVFGGETIEFIPQGMPGWGYLAVLGGIDVPPVMGSRATYLRGRFGGFGGRSLLEGDVLPVGEMPSAGAMRRAGRWLPPEGRPHYAPNPLIPVLPGPQLDAFTPEALQTLLSAEYRVSATSDRMGYRLTGPRLEHTGSADLISEPLPWGALQVPADGLPMAMMADRPTTGGYPKIAVVARAGLPLLAQAMPGQGQVRFRTVNLAEARSMYAAQLAALVGGIEEDEDGEWTG
jgi:biotin-dependent carboxylase-like uncharacterized protein